MENTLIYNHFKIDLMTNINYLERIKELSKEIDEVYFLDYSHKRNELLKEKIIDLLKLVDENLNNINNLNKNEISFLYFIKSLCLDKLPEYSKIAEESANKSV